MDFQDAAIVAMVLYLVGCCFWIGILARALFGV